MNGFFEQFIDNLKDGQKGRVEDIALASIQHYSNEIVATIGKIPPRDIIFYMAAFKTINKVLEEAYPYESKLAEGLTRMISTEALVISHNNDGLPEITRIKSSPKRS